MRTKDGVKYLTAKRLIELLREIPPDNLVSVNKVGNLRISSVDGDFIGFIDFICDGEVYIKEQDEED